MKPLIVVLAAIWIYPVFALFVMLALKDKPKSRKAMLIVATFFASIGIIGCLTGYSTVSENTDWFFVSTIYLLISLFIWRVVFYPNNWVKVLGMVFVLLTFGYGYYNGSVRIKEITYKMGEFEHNGKIRINDRLSYTESILGNAKSEIRGKRIEIFANPEHFPFLERMIFEQSYPGIPQFSVPAKVVYEEAENTVYFSIPAQRKSRYRLKGWSDTVDLDLY